MSTIAARSSYRRVPGTLWRDTGVHVLALPPGGQHDVVVLGGGGALLWRLLGQPLDILELREALTEPGELPPDADEVSACVDELLSRGLLTQLWSSEGTR